MTIHINLRVGIILATLVVLTTAGVVYAQIQRSVSGSAIVGQVLTVQETILLWETIDPKTELTEVNFGEVDFDPFGKPFLGRTPIWVENGAAISFTLTVEAANVMVTPPGDGAQPMDDAVRILFGPAGEDLLPAPDHAVTIDPGEENMFAGELLLEFLKTPDELGGAGTQLTFEILFKAKEVAKVHIALDFDSLPSEQGWTYTTRGIVPETSVFSVSDGILIQNSLGVGFAGQGNNSYEILDAVDPILPFTISVTARVLEETGAFTTNSFGFAFFGVTGTEWFAVGLGTSRIEDGLETRLKTPVLSG